jgi:hypothetical protein
VVDHVGAPQAEGQRFDLRYDYYTRRNHCLLLLRNRGIPLGVAWRYVRSAAASLWRFMVRRSLQGRPDAGAARFVAGMAGLTVGCAVSVGKLLQSGRNPRRRDDKGRALAAALWLDAAT